MSAIIECVPNFSEGRDLNKIEAITSEMAAVEGVMLLNTDPGKATNRTVVTLAGSPEAVIEAAFRGIRKAAELIDMSKHKGEHPRMGATDVCPLIPLSGISMEETAEYARKLARRVGEELQIPVYLYEEAQPDKKRSNLSVIREGEYEGFFKKIQRPEWKPDFGPAVFSPKSGATVIGARDFLVAYNVNLNTTSTRRANSVAFDVREAGRVMREGDPITGKVVLDEQGQPKSIPGSLKSVKAIGWYIEEYGCAQISMNLTNIRITPLHIAFDEVCNKASARGLRVTGSELVGLVPLSCMLDAGTYFLAKQQRSAGVGEEELVRIAVMSMGLDQLAPFDPQERIIEYVLRRKQTPAKLVAMPFARLCAETASESPAPGGGSVSAAVAALGTSLGVMVANLSGHKKGWDHRWKEFSDWATEGQRIKDELLFLVDEDTRAFNGIMEAFGLPKATDAERQVRTAAIQQATRYAIEVPLRAMRTASSAWKLIEAMVKDGNPNSITDAGVGALCLNAAIRGAWMNVLVNARGFDDEVFLNAALKEGNQLLEDSALSEQRITRLVFEKIG